MFKKKQKVDDFLTKSKVIIAKYSKNIDFICFDIVITKWLHFRVEFYNLKNFWL